jgi:hypothetical protein
MSNLTEKKASNLKRAYDKIDALGIEMNIVQFMEVGTILRELASSEWKEGSEATKKIYKQ